VNDAYTIDNPRQDISVSQWLAEWQEEWKRKSNSGNNNDSEAT